MTQAQIAALVHSYVIASVIAREELDIELDQVVNADGEDVIESVIVCDNALTCVMESGREICLAADGTISE